MRPSAADRGTRRKPIGTTPAADRPIATARRLAAKRCALVFLTALIATNILIGAPLLALWIGSRVAGTTVLSMSAVFVVVGVLAAVVFPMSALLLWLNSRYRDLVRLASPHTRAPWLRSLGGEAEDEIDVGARITLVERIVVFFVHVAVVAFVVWFLFFAGSPLPQS